MKKWVVAWCLCCLMLVLPAVALADSSESDFAFNANAGIITQYLGEGGDVVIPDSIGGVAVQAIGDYVFAFQPAITSVSMPDGITHIGQFAFTETSLTTVRLPKAVTAVLPGTFSRCPNLESIEMPEGIRFIGSDAFAECSALTTIKLSASLETLDASAFYWCENLREIEIPANVGLINSRAFMFAFALEQIRFLCEVPHIGSETFPPVEDLSENLVVTVPKGLKEAYERALSLPCTEGDYEAFATDRSISLADLDFDPATGTIREYTGGQSIIDFPAQINGIEVTAIGDRALLNHDYARIINLPEGVTSIGEAAFSRVYLVDISLPESLTHIGKDAFTMSHLSHIVIPEGVVEIGDGAFNNGWALDASFPSTLKRIGAAAFEGNGGLVYLNFNSIELPEIVPGAFNGCEITDVDIRYDATKKQQDIAKTQLLAAKVNPFRGVWRADLPDQPPYPQDGGATTDFDEDTHLITAYTGDQREMTSFWSFYVGDESQFIKGLGEGVFANGDITRFTVPRSNAFTIIGDRAFENSSLEQIDLFDSITEIGVDAFKDCVNLTEILLPESVRTIGDGAFDGCTNLTKLLMPADAQVSPETLSNIPYDVLYVYKDTTDEQRTALSQLIGRPFNRPVLREGEAYDIVVMPDTLKPNDEKDFSFDEETGAIMAYIGDNLDVVIPRTIDGIEVNAIGVAAFSAYNFETYGLKTFEKIKSVTIPETVTEIGDNAFAFCPNLEVIDCYGALTRIGLRAFEEAASLKAVNLHGGVFYIDQYAFTLCKNLKSIDLGSYLDTTGEGAFYLTGLESVTADMRVIGPLAFWDCKGLKEVHITARVEGISNGLFMGAEQLESVCIEHPTEELFPEYSGLFTDTPDTAVIYVPVDSTEEQIAQMENVLRNRGNNFKGTINRRDCERFERTQMFEQPPIEPESDPAPETESAPDPLVEQRGFTGRTYVAVSATTGGVDIDLSMLGQYEVVFNDDGTCAITISGVTLEGASWKDDGETITASYYGIPYDFVREGNGFTMDYNNTMIVTYAVQ